MEEFDNLYVNLSDEQQAALDKLDKALDACMDADVKHPDVQDTTNVWIDRIKQKAHLARLVSNKEAARARLQAMHTKS